MPIETKNMKISLKHSGTRGRAGNSLPLQPLSFPPRPSGLGFCETPQAFRSKKVRAFSIIVHQTGFCKFLETDREVCSPCLRAWRARNEAVKSNGRTKSQDAIFHLAEHNYQLTPKYMNTIQQKIFSTSAKVPM